MQMSFPHPLYGKDPKTKRGLSGYPGYRLGRILKAQSYSDISCSHLLLKSAGGFSTVLLAPLRDKQCLKAASFPVKESPHYTRWHCLILTSCSACSLDPEHPAAAVPSGFHRIRGSPAGRDAGQPRNRGAGMIYRDLC